MSTPSIDSVDIVVALIAAIWARESARSQGFERINRIRDCIVTGYANNRPVDKSFRVLMYEADWYPQAVGATAATFLFALIVVGLWFLAGKSEDWYAILCTTVALYQISSGLSTGWAFFKDARYIRTVLDKPDTNVERLETIQQHP